MSRIFFALLFVVVLVPGSSLAQVTGSVSGRVIDETGAPLVGATVYLQGSQTGAATDMDGRFSILQVPVGTYNLVVSFVGFTSQTLFNINVKSVGNPDFNFKLPPDIAALGGVIVTPDKNVVTRPLETPLSTQTLTSVELATYPGGNNDVVRVAQSLPGISPSPGGFRNDLIIRGGAPNESVYYLDGVEIPNINHFSTQGSSGGPVGLLNVSFIDNVTLSSSAFGAQYDNALSGVLQFDQREGNRQVQSANLRVSASETALTLNGPLFKGRDAEAKTTYIASVRRSYLQFLFEVIGLPIRPDYWDYQYKVSHRFNETNTLNIIGVGSIDNFTVEPATDLPLSEQSILDQTPFIIQKSNTTGVSWRKRFSGGRGFMVSTLSNNFLYNDFSRYADNSAREGRYFNNDSREIETKFRYALTLFKEGWQITTGFNVQQSQYDNKTEDLNAGFSYDTNIRFKKGGVFASANRDFLRDKLNVNFGLRADDDSFLNNQSLLNTVSPRVSLSYSLGAQWKVNGTVGRYYKLPPYTILGYQTAGKLVNKDNKYVRADHVVLGLERILGPAANLSVEGFIKRYANYPVSLLDGISLANKGADFEVLGNEAVSSIGTGRTYGAEVLYQQKLQKRFYGILSYTFFFSEFSGADGSGQYRPSVWDSRHLASFTGGYKLGRNWEVSTRFRFAGSTPSVPTDQAKTLQLYPQVVLDYDRIGEESLGSLNQLDIRIDKKWNLKKVSLDLFLEFQNVLMTSAPEPIQYVLSRDAQGNPIEPRQLTRLPASDAALIPTIGFVLDL
jgi:hypothetical protein